MNREEMKKYIGITGYSLGQVEKDYFQHIILSAISRKIGGSLIFKGGTALQKSGIIPRFSEDLDFTAAGQISSSYLQNLALRSIQAYNYHGSIDQIIDDKRTLSFRIKIEGPLYRNNRVVCTIKIEISRRETVILPPQTAVFSPPYYDILPYAIKIMHNEEMAAEKIRAIYTRNRPRDIYDLYQLIRHGTQIKTDIVSRKLKYYNIEFDMKTFIRRCEESSVKWESVLIELVEDVPPMEEVVKAVTEAVKDSFA